ncbi:MAG: alpha/beta fold hydrolase [Crocinitomicaceae bacterium]|nr:alpha/beta fold hydrolase [Crocinitomicaceae bacterium]
MHYLRILFLLLIPISSWTQISGDWHAMLEVGPTQIPLDIHIDFENNVLTLDSPDQQVMGKNVDTLVLTDSTVYFEIRAWKVRYTGKYDQKKELINGEFFQAGVTFPLNFGRDEIEKKEIKRPQNPPDAVEYEVLEVSFKNKKGKFELHGTLTIPKGDGPFPAVVLASGTGQQDRNEEMIKHKPFHVLAHHLTSNGVMVLRFDDRFFGESQPKFFNSTMEDFASDVSSAIDFLSKQKKVDKDKLGVVGHSEGGIHGPIAASQNKKIKFIVSMAGVGVRGIDLLIRQRRLLLGVEGVTLESTFVKDSLMLLKIYNEIKSEDGLKYEETQQIVKDFFDNLTEEEIKEFGDSPSIVKQQIPQFFAMKAIQSFLEYDPKLYWDQVQIPVLALNGSRDIQVEPTQNLTGFKSLFNHPKCETYLFDGLNHLFQKCESCTISEYGSIETTIEPEVLDKITSWIKGL